MSKNDELYHHGVQGQKWGVKNGPPYPLDSAGQLKAIQNLNTHLNSWPYGVLINGEKITNVNDVDWSQYKTTPVDILKKERVGICWDFVNVQHSEFKKRGYPDETYMYVTGSDDSNLVTHSFSIVNIGDKKYWFESSWFKHQGVHEVNSYQDVVDILNKEYRRNNDFDIYSYNPDGMDQGLTNGEYFQKATQNLKYSSKMQHFVGFDDDDSLTHYGMPRRSGRYPWGSGDNPYQHSRDFMARVKELRDKNFTFTDPETGEFYTGDTAIAKSMGMNTTEFRARYSNARYIRRNQDMITAQALLKKGYSPAEIVSKLDLKNESSLRSLLNEESAARMNKARATADFLKKQIDEKGMIEVGGGLEYQLGVSKVKLNQALTILKDEGYPVYGGSVMQATNPNQKTNILVACPPGTPHRDIYTYDDIHFVDDSISYDGGDTFKPKFAYPASLDSKRMQVVYGDQGGVEKDGLIEIRPGCEDLSLQGSKYAQVRILVDGTHYLKGMAVYNDKLPEGIDIRFNTNKPTGSPIMGPDKDTSVLKPIKKKDPNDPFGSALKEEGGQYYYVDKSGKEKLGLINKTREEGDWADWSDKLPSQFLAKQAPELVDKQLKLTVAEKAAEFDSIMALENPTVKRILLNKFAEERDSDSVHLKAAALPRQKYQVLIPMPGLKDNECYDPRFENGERVALIRYPHAGTFEIPILKVNNNIAEGRNLLGTTTQDAIGINHKVAQQLSGADFDGDAVTVIPVGRKVKISYREPLRTSDGKLITDFDPGMEYPKREGMKFMTKQNTQIEMGKISNLITDMTIKGATDDEMIKAVKHSMVVIDAEKHAYDYQKSYQDNNISALKKKYQGYIDVEGDEHGGASTLISRAKGQMHVDKRVGSPKVNQKGKPWYDPERPEGALIYKEVKEYYKNKDGKIVQRTTKSNQMSETDDARTLSSGSPVEESYAAYANQMKKMANQARIEAINTGRLKYDPEAKKAYSAEVKSLQDKLTESMLNRPKEKRAQLLTANKVKAMKENNPDMDKEEMKKFKNRTLKEMRARVGAKRVEIEVTDREWEAIQKGAISDTKLSQMLPRMDIDDLRRRSMPKDYKRNISQAQINRMSALQNSGYTLAQIASMLGVSTSTVSNYLK